MLIADARLRGRDGRWNLRIDDGRFTAIEPAGGGPSESDDEIVGSAAVESAGPDTYHAEGRLVVPQFVENHIHLDYANTAGVPRVNESGTLFEAIEIWGERKEQGLHQADQVYDNALAAVRRAVLHGVGHIRTHVDVTDPDLTGLEALARLRADVRDWVELQVVAFPQNGVFAYPGGDDLMRRAMDSGADVVGGIPHLEPTIADAHRSLELIFDLAQEHDVLVDIHTDEIDDASSRFVNDVAAETTARGMQGRVTISHAVAMAYYDPGYIDRLMPKLVEAGVGFAIAPTENLQLQGRGFGPPTPRGVAPVATLVQWGLPVGFGQDSMVDPFYPVGDGDPLRNLEVGLHVAHMLVAQYLDRCLDFITVDPATNLGLTDRYGIEEGRPAGLLVLDATSDVEALRTRADVLLSIHDGREVFRRDPARIEWAV